MTIYKLTQNTWNGGEVGDFSLPKTLGHSGEAVMRRPLVYFVLAPFAGLVIAVAVAFC